MRRAAKIDDNQRAIVKALRSVPGVTVRITSMVGHGFPDLAVGHRGRNYFLEIKDSAKPPSARRLTPEEQLFFDTWQGHCAVVMSMEEALNVVLERGK